MLNVERFIRKQLDTCAQRLGLRPRRYPTKEKAIVAGVEEFFKDDSSKSRILNLPPAKEKDKDQAQGKTTT